MTEGKMVGWHHQLNAREFEQAPDDEGWGSLACCSSWGRKEWNTTERLNNTLSYALTCTFFPLHQCQLCAMTKMVSIQYASH